MNDSFIIYLLEIIEGVSDDAEDDYHYPVIRVLVSNLEITCPLILTIEVVGSERTVSRGIH